MASAEEVAAMRLLFEQQQARFEEQHQAFVADQQTRAAQTQQLLENNNNLAARIDELLRLGQSEQDKRQELERELAEERARSAQSKPLVDVSKLGQKPPEKFTNTEAAWAPWSFDHRNYLAAANPAARPALLFAEKAGDVPRTEDDVAARGWAVISEQL